MTGPTPISHLLDGCRHGDAQLSQVPQTAGKPRVCMWCLECRRIVSKEKGYPGIWIAYDHPDLAGKDIPNLPVAYDTRVYRRCEGPCKSLTLCELHHVAPQVFFGDEAEEWPAVWFCRACHERWHAVVTPGLCTPHDAVAHACTLLDYLRLDRAAALTRELTTQGRARRAGAA